MGKSFSVKFDPRLALAELDRVSAASRESIRPAAQAGAQVFYDEVVLNVSKIGRVTGNLASSIYQAYSADNSSETKATYHISWNASKAPHGHLVEYGHLMTRKAYIGSDGNWYTSKIKIEPKHVGARPFLRPAFDAKRSAVLEAMEKRWLEGIAV